MKYLKDDIVLIRLNLGDGNAEFCVAFYLRETQNNEHKVIDEYNGPWPVYSDEILDNFRRNRDYTQVM